MEDHHQEEEDGCCDGPDSVLGRVRDIRRKWAVQEDEALAYRLQDEEIAQHYNSNRTRNAIVREDAPRAREAQRQEELQAIEERLNHLSILQKQAEEDGKFAKLLSTREADAPKGKKQSLSPSNGMAKDNKPSPQELLHNVTNEIAANIKQIKSPLLGAARQPTAQVPGPSRSCLNHTGEAQLQEDDFTKEQIRKIQEEKDAAIAKAMQEELDRYERDKLLALEAQDRELAKMLHEKERARLRRAKEKARLKAEAAALDRVGTPDGDSDGRTASRNSCSSERSRSSDVLAPRVPEKLKSPTGEQIGFRANPKPLPPHPSSQDISPSVSNHSRLEHHRLPMEPVPPYMPIHGYNRSSPKRNK